MRPLMLAAVTLALNGKLALRAETPLESRLALIRTAGDPASIADLAPQPIPDDKNAAVILERIGSRLAEFSKDHAHFFNTPIGQSYDQGQDRGEPPTPEQIFEIRLILVKYPDIEEALGQAADCDDYASLRDYTPLADDAAFTCVLGSPHISVSLFDRWWTMRRFEVDRELNADMVEADLRPLLDRVEPTGHPQVDEWLATLRGAG